MSVCLKVIQILNDSVLKLEHLVCHSELVSESHQYFSVLLVGFELQKKNCERYLDFIKNKHYQYTSSVQLQLL